MIRNLKDDESWPEELANAGAKLLVVDFYADWCGPCKAIAPFFAQLPTKYPNAVFLKVNVEECEQTAVQFGIRAMPTFLAFRNSQKIDAVQGGNPQALEDMVKKWYSAANDVPASISKQSGGADLIDLSSLIHKEQCVCLNSEDEKGLIDMLEKSTPIRSDPDTDDCQILMNLTFTQPVKLHSLQIDGPSECGPNEVKLWTNLPSMIGFDEAESMAAAQEISVMPTDLEAGSVIPLKYVKFQNVQNLTMFVRNNQSGDPESQTVIDKLGFFGKGVALTNMNEFKRVGGKKGESH